MTDISNYSFIEILRDYAAERKGELAFNMNEAADRLEQAEWDIKRLRDQISGPKWITGRTPTEDEIAFAGDIGFIVCISGTNDTWTYERAVDMGGNFFEDGEWYLHGVKMPETITVLGFMLPPEWED